VVGLADKTFVMNRSTVTYRLRGVRMIGTRRVSTLKAFTGALVRWPQAFRAASTYASRCGRASA
jgi:hypothetical protein